mgnify:CR=1 FL=1
MSRTGRPGSRRGGGPPPNPAEPDRSPFWELYQLTATPISVQGVVLNNANGAERWGVFMGPLGEALGRVDPSLRTAGPQPISREASNRRLAEGRFGPWAMTTTEQDAERTGRPGGEQPSIPERLGTHLTDTYFRGGEPQHLRRRLLEYYQQQTGKPWEPPTEPRTLSPWERDLASQGE